MASHMSQLTERELPLHVLYLGDSITHTTRPLMLETDTHAAPLPPQYAINALQGKLGRGATVNNASFSGRNTCSDERAPWAHPDDALFNGSKVLKRLLDEAPSCGYSCVVLQLGTNDLREPHRRTPVQITAEMRALVRASRAACGPSATVIVVAPPHMDMSDANSSAFMRTVFGEFEADIDNIARLYQGMCSEEGVLFLAASEVGLPRSGDGVHFSSEQSVRLGELVAEKILHAFKDR